MAMDMTTALTMKANVVGQSQISGLEKGLGRVTGQTNKATTAMGRLRGAASGALGAMRSFLPVLGVAGVAAFAKRNLDAADSMSKLSQRTGIAAPMLDKFRKVAELSDTSIESLERAFPALTKNMDIAAQKGKGPAFEAFERLGISVQNADGSLRAADDVMLQVSDRFANMADGAEKSALASQIFGTRIGSELIPLLNSGGDAVRGMGTALTQDFADKAAAFNDKLENVQEKLGDMALKLTEALLPALEAIIPAIESLVTGFTSLPGPVQGLIVALGGIAAVAVVFAPLVTALTTIGPLLGGLVTAIGPVVAAVKGLGVILAGVFSGPVGWVALAVAAGVAIFKFRDEIGSAFQAVGNTIKDAADAFNQVFVQPVIQGGQAVYDGLVNTLSQIGEALRAPFEAAANMIKGIVNGILNGVGNAIGSVVNAINNVIRGANNALAKLQLPQIPFLPMPNIPKFAKGGMVTGPTLGLVGEAGPEYIVPARKAQGFAQNILAGVRGPGAIPRFAEGGFVAPSSASVSIQTGPVTQMDGQNFVTTADLGAAVEAGVLQTLDIMNRDLMARGSVGIA
jgi:phage-related minor tail protein